MKIHISSIEAQIEAAKQAKACEVNKKEFSKEIKTSMKISKMADKITDNQTLKT